MIELNNVEVVVFSTPSCSNCKPLKAWLTAQGVGFTEVNCDDVDSLERMATYNIKSVPTTLTFREGKCIGRVAGFKPKELEAVLQD